MGSKYDDGVDTLNDLYFTDISSIIHVVAVHSARLPDSVRTSIRLEHVDCMPESGPGPAIWVFWSVKCDREHVAYDI